MLAGVTGVNSSADAVAALYAGSFSRLVGVVALAAGSTAEAEECVQEAFVRLLREWPKVARYDDPEAWVRLAAFRLLSNRRRKARNGLRALVRVGPSEPTRGPTVERVGIEAALSALPIAQRQVVVLHYLLDMDVAGISQVLDLPPGTVKSRLSRARSALGPLLSEENARA